MHIIHLAAELAPLVKAGGLADVVHGLSAEQARLGHTVKVIVPLYKFLKPKDLKLKNLNENFVIHEKNSWHNNQIYQKIIDGVEVIFIEAHHPEKYFNQENIYGYDNDISRFIYFSRAALEILLNQKTTIDILHLHDWHTSIAAVISKDILKNHNLTIKATVLTVHNFHYQGKCNTHDLDQIDLDGKKYLQKNLLQDPNPNYPESINLLKGGIIYSDAVTTVSESYAQELLDGEHAYGLEKIIKKSKKKLFGIMNGLDELQWDPSKDKSIKHNFSTDQTAAEIRDCKSKNKNDLCLEIGLRNEDKPLFIFIGRLVKQKGIDLLEPAIEYIIKEKGLFVLCGSAASQSTQDRFEALNQKYKNSKKAYFNFTYNERLSRKMYSSADFILVPSLFEPCGLVQLIAMRYGTVPIVRKTGGLNDSIKDIKLKSGYQNGIVFDKFDEKAFIESIERAYKLYNKNEFENLSKKIMGIDFGWSLATSKYLNIYKKFCS